MGNRKRVEAPVEEGPVKAKGGPIEQQETGGGPKVVDVPPPKVQLPGDGALSGCAEPGC